MKIGQRNYLILKEIIRHSDDVTGKMLEAKFHLSRKQLEYGIARINDYLEEQQLPKLRRLSNGRIIIAEEAVGQLDLDWLEQENQEVWLSKEERCVIIGLMLLTNETELSLQHFIVELKVSRNTVLADLKSVKEQMAAARLILTHSRETGYQLGGAEYDLRQQLVAILRRIISLHRKPALITRIGAITKKQLDHTRQITVQIEEALNTRFTDEMMEINSSFFALLFRRIKKGLILRSVPEVLHHVVGTGEYMVIKDVLSAEGVDILNETIYLTAHIQSMKTNKPLEVVAGQQEIRQAVEETITNFERLACVRMKAREDVYNLLLNHSVPALHRIRYNFHVGPDISEYVLPDYQEIHNIVKKSVIPLERLIGMSFPESELVYITLIFIAQIKGDEEDGSAQRLKAVVVCQNGITVSHFLLTLLERTFPEIDFVTYLSVRQFYEYKSPYDLVFTAVPLQTASRQFIIEPFMNEEKRKQLRKKVFDSLKNKKDIFPQIDTVLQIIQRHTNERVFQKLHHEIHSYMAGPGESYDYDNKRKPELKELLTASNIRIINESMGWKEAIEFAAVPLLYQNVIQYQYVETIISDIMERQQIMLVADQVMIAHAGIDAGVYDVGMSLLLLPKAIMVNGYMEVKVLFVLATPDRERHLTALNQLIDLLEDEEKLKTLKQARNITEILALL